MKLYISGRMSGVAGFNIPAFDEMAWTLRSRQHEVISPAELDEPKFRKVCLESDGSKEDLQRRCTERGLTMESWGDLLARDIKLLANEGIEGIVVLPEWYLSKGALLESFAARLLDIFIYEWAPTREMLVHVPLSKLERVHAYGPVSQTKTEDNLSKFPPICEVRKSAFTAREAPTFSQTKTEVRVADPETGAEKAVKDEVEGDLCPKALIELAKVCGFGRKKYARLNYLKGYNWSSSYDAMQRHLKAFWAGEEINDESGLHHLAHGAWHALALLAYTIRKVGKDDRP